MNENFVVYTGSCNRWKPVDTSIFINGYKNKQDLNYVPICV